MQTFSKQTKLNVSLHLYDIHTIRIAIVSSRIKSHRMQYVFNKFETDNSVTLHEDLPAKKQREEELNMGLYMFYAHT